MTDKPKCECPRCQSRRLAEKILQAIGAERGWPDGGTIVGEEHAIASHGLSMALDVVLHRDLDNGPVIVGNLMATRIGPPTPFTVPDEPDARATHEGPGTRQ